MNQTATQARSGVSPADVRRECLARAQSLVRAGRVIGDDIAFAAVLAKFVNEQAATINSGLEIVWSGAGDTPEQVIASGARLQAFYELGIIFPSSP